MEKASKAGKTKRMYLSLAIILFLFAGLAMLIRSYFLTNQTYPQLTKQNEIKYNDPLLLNDLPKFSTNTDLNIFPNREVQLEDSQNLWLKIKSNNNYYVGYLDSNLTYNISYILPPNIEDIKIFEDNKIFFILENENGRGASLIFKQNSNTLEILNLKPSEFFTGYYYSPSEKLFYISTGNSDGKYNLFSFRVGQNKAELLELSSSFKILKSTLDSAFIKHEDGCKELSFATKSLSSIDCNQIFLNSQNLNFSQINNQLKLFKDNNSKVIFTAGSNEIIGRAQYFNKYIYFAVYSTNEGAGKTPLKLYKSDLDANLTEIASAFPDGDIDFSLFFNSQLIINKYFGIERVFKLTENTPVSYPQDLWQELKIITEEITKIDLLGPDYQI